LLGRVDLTLDPTCLSCMPDPILYLSRLCQLEIGLRGIRLRNLDVLASFQFTSYYVFSPFLPPLSYQLIVYFFFPFISDNSKHQMSFFANPLSSHRNLSKFMLASFSVFLIIEWLLLYYRSTR